MTDKFNYASPAITAGHHGKATADDTFQVGKRTRICLFVTMMSGIPALAFALAWYAGTGETTKYGITALVLLFVAAIAGLKLTAAGAEDEQRAKEKRERKSP